MTKYDDTKEQSIRLKDIPKGTFFKRNATSSKVYLRGAYIREVKKYDCIAHNMGDDIMLKGSSIVFTGFTY